MQNHSMFQFQEFRKNMKPDLLAGFILFLIALPLSVGISLASGAPATAGLLSAIVGGILGTFFCGGHVMINGPAAGLIVVVLTSIQQLGNGDATVGFKLTLAAIIVAGVLQIVLGLIRAGTLGLCVPINVLHGMLAAIGVTIVVKQIFVLAGLKPQGESTLSQMLEIPQAIAHANWVILFMGLLCVTLVLLLNAQKKGFLKYIPSSLAAVILGIIFDKVFDLEHLHSISFLDHTFEVGSKYLLHVPTDLKEAFFFPDFSRMTEPLFIKMVISICFVASIESVLSAYAVDKLDPLKRKTNLNWDLVGKGLCNTFLGFIGGLPIITEIVRSSANINNGAQTRWSNFFHGIFILAFLVLFPNVLNLIPLAAFAAVLIIVGFRLGHPKQLLHAKNIGWDQFILFAGTLIITLKTDLLVGVGSGLLIKFILTIIRSQTLAGIFKLSKTEIEANGTYYLTVNGPAVFTNLLKVKGALDAHSQAPQIELNLQKATYIDHTFMDFTENYAREMKDQGRTLKILDFPDHKFTADHPLASRRLSN